MPISLEVHPRRIVRPIGGGSALVLIRRWVPAKFNGWNSWDIRWELQHLWKLLRRDHRWSVELYYGIADDPGGTPACEPDRRWICADRHAATSFGDTLSEHIADHGMDDDLPSPLPPST